MATFEEPEVMMGDDDGGTALAAVTRGEIDMQIATAKKYPRDELTAKNKIRSIACMDEETAEACYYALPRGGKTIYGPSIRLAEIAVACYKNLRAGARVVSVITSGDNPHVSVQAVCHDLENNVAITIEKRRRITKKKSKNAIDEDDVNLAANACSSIALRDAVFKIVPMAIIKPVWQSAKQVAIGNAQSLANKRSVVVDKLKKMGAKEANIFAVVEATRIEEIDLDKLAILIGLGTSIKDGEVTVDAAFPDPASAEKPADDQGGKPGQSRADALAERMLGKKEKEKEKDGAAKKPEAPEPEDGQVAAKEGRKDSDAEAEQSPKQQAEKPTEAEQAQGAEPTAEQTQRTPHESRVLQSWMASIAGVPDEDALYALHDEFENSTDTPDSIKPDVNALFMRRRNELKPTKKGGKK